MHEVPEKMCSQQCAWAFLVLPQSPSVSFPAHNPGVSPGHNQVPRDLILSKLNTKEIKRRNEKEN